MKANVQYEWDHKTQTLKRDTSRNIPSGYTPRQKKILQEEKHPPKNT